MNSTLLDPLGALSKANKAKESPGLTDRQSVSPVTNKTAFADVDLILGRTTLGERSGASENGSPEIVEDKSRPRWDSSSAEGASSASTSKLALNRQKLEPDLSTRVGRLVATNFRVRILLKKGETPESDVWLLRTGYLDFPWGCVKEIQQEQSPKGVRIALSTKDRRHLTIDVLEKDISVAVLLGNELIYLTHQFAWPLSRHQIFAFAYAEKRWNAGGMEGLDGWQLYDPLREYGRMDLDCDKHAKGAPWYISTINKDYKLCDSYPSWIVVPKRFPHEELCAVAEFRKKNRLPVLSWCGPHLNHAGLFRSSQTTEGVMGQRCSADERLMQFIAKGTGQKEQMLILDLRPRKAAIAQKVVGGGIEDSNSYRLKFAGIENIHHVRTAYSAMGQAVQNALSPDVVGTWFQDVAASKWYDLLGVILQAVKTVVEEMQQCRSVLVHCSDGWDRTAQTTALVMLVIDPFYRTFTGIFTLIQKEFCSFGHRFRTRLANGEKATSEYSPVFFQWLDAVYQIVVQNPDSFEFTPALLPLIARESISNKYGTFLSDSEKEICDYMLPHTMSVWTELLRPEVCEEYRNDAYIPSNVPLTIEINQVKYKMWDDFWFERTPLHKDKVTATAKSAVMARDESSLKASSRTSSPVVAREPILQDESLVAARVDPKTEEKTDRVAEVVTDAKKERKQSPAPAWDFDGGHDPFA
eukprot:GEMP01011053.1.p1 GENE.GEMP01011053.1~~GEMP01011053.1.p1  ORF type:complete len:697 (+),score=93.59 GEMP01011053.1:318-2408(+)